MVGGGQLQMIALLRVGDAPPRQEGAPDESGPAAVLLNHAEVDMVGEGGVNIRAEGVKNQGELLPIGNGKALLTGAGFGQLVKAEAEGLPEQPGQPLGKVAAGGDDADLLGGKGVAIEQHAVALRQSAALLLRPGRAQLPFGIG